MFDDLIPTIIQILIEEKMVVSEIAEESRFWRNRNSRGLSGYMIWNCK